LQDKAELLSCAFGMIGRGAGTARGKTILAIDHAFIGSEDDDLAESVYLALAELEIAWPGAIAPMRIDDLAVLCDVRDSCASGSELSTSLREASTGACRRIRHVLDRSDHGPRAAGGRS
jgi:hypothetical protein